MRIRPYTATDAPELHALFRDTILRVNCRDYSAEQVRVWAADDVATTTWADRFAGRYTIVAEADEVPVGFADVAQDGHVGRFFVHADHQGRGVGRALLAELEAEVCRRHVRRLSTEASITARRFFERNGFTVTREQVVEYHRVKFVNYAMEKVIAEG